MSPPDLAGQRTLAINELQSLLQHLQQIEAEEEQLMAAAADRATQARHPHPLPALPLNSANSVLQPCK